MLSTINKYFKNEFFGDFTGGVTTSLLALPGTIAYGCLVFSPLGNDYIHIGVTAGLLSLIFINLGSSIFGSIKILNSGPFSLSSFMMVTIVVSFISFTNFNAKQNLSELLTLIFLTVLFAGIFQLLFGIFKFGELTKYIPYPVLSGLFNGTAILIFAGQIKPLMGINSYGNIQNLLFLNIITGVITFIIIQYGNRITEKIPAPFLGILAGSIFYYIIIVLGMNSSVTSTIGKIPSAIPEPKYLPLFINYITAMDLDKIILYSKKILPLSFGLAIIISLRTLIAGISADNLSLNRSNSNRELIAQGFGNITVSIFGGIIAAGSVSRTVGNYKYGGRTIISRVICGLSALSILVFLNPLVSLIPKVVLSGMLMYLAVTVFDKWSIKLFKRVVFSNEEKDKEEVIDLVIVIFVTLIMIFIGIFEALGIGFIISIFVFLKRMERHVVNRQYNASIVRANVERPASEIKVLEKEGKKIIILELRGSLFFGTADRVSEIVNDIFTDNSEYIILDFKRVSDIDSTGIHILTQLLKLSTSYDKKLLFSSVENYIKDFESINTGSVYYSLEDALSVAENDIIQKNKKNESDESLALNEIDTLSGLNEKDIEKIKKFVIEKKYEKGDVIFSEGDSGDKIFFILKGEAEIFITLAGGMHKRLSTLLPGTVFGEMAIIDGKPRSAGVIAAKDMHCAYLSQENIDILYKEEPYVALKVLTGLGRDLSKRVRIANNIIGQLKL